MPESCQDEAATWTAGEDATLSAVYAAGGSAADAISDLPSRSIDAIRHRAVRLGVARRAPRTWSSEEDDAIRDAYPYGGARAVSSRVPHRSPHAIMQRARALGVSKTRALRVHITAIIDADDRIRLRELARARGVTASELIRDAVRSLLDAAGAR